MNDKYLTVTAVTKYIKHQLDLDPNLRTVYLKGEISNFKNHSSGHYYFSIKDETSIIKAIMFRGNTAKLPFLPEEGMKVFVEGSISVYEAGGTYQIYVTDMMQDGVGNLYIAFEKLKEKLAKEGLFDSKYKKTLPKYPQKIGVITAATGAAIRDIFSTIKRRYPICQTYLFPCLVQGETAPQDIVNKIKQADQYGFDLLIVGRGGGSFEDLNCFNDEQVARTIFGSKTPIISAVGHEIDYTIADFVADLRAPTPTGAAEMAVPNLIDVIHTLNQYQIRCQETMLKKIKYSQLVMDSLKNSFVIKNPQMMYLNIRQKLDLDKEKSIRLLKEKLKTEQLRLDHLKKHYILTNPKRLYEKQVLQLQKNIEKLTLLNPLGVIKRGYTITYLENKNALQKIDQVKTGDILTTVTNNGSITSQVMKIEKEKKNAKEI